MIFYLEFFINIPLIRRKLQTIKNVGLGYICLGQQATTLSGGEAQRIKLSSELSRVSTGRTIYILDEPTTGLHFADVGMLLGVLSRLVDKGNTVIVIEHNMDVIKCADHIISTVLPLSHQMDARDRFRFVGAARARYQEGGVGSCLDSFLEVSRLAELEGRVIERLLRQRNQECHPPADRGQDADPPADEPSHTDRCAVDVADVELVAGGAGAGAGHEVENVAGSTEVPGGFGRGSTCTRPSTIRTLNVGIRSVKGAGDCPESG